MYLLHCFFFVQENNMQYWDVTFREIEFDRGSNL